MECGKYTQRNTKQQNRMTCWDVNTMTKFKTLMKKEASHKRAPYLWVLIWGSKICGENCICTNTGRLYFFGGCLCGLNSGPGTRQMLYYSSHGGENGFHPIFASPYFHLVPFLSLDYV
jgi:hypothetical protein